MIQNTENSNPTCYSCTAFVIDGDKAYCDDDNFDNEYVQKAKTFEPAMFECVGYERCPD
jgi:hypothetical protein